MVSLCMDRLYLWTKNIYCCHGGKLIIIVIFIGLSQMSAAPGSASCCWQLCRVNKKGYRPLKIMLLLYYYQYNSATLCGRKMCLSAPVCTTSVAYPEGAQPARAPCLVSQNKINDHISTEIWNRIIHLRP